MRRDIKFGYGPSAQVNERTSQKKAIKKGNSLVMWKMNKANVIIVYLQIHHQIHMPFAAGHFSVVRRMDD